MDSNKILHLAAEAGRIILENGGETYRVEETIARICDAYALYRADSFVTPTGIMLSVTDKYGNTTSIIKRIRIRTVDLNKIARVNDLSRNMKSRALTLEDALEELHKIDKEKSYSKGIVVLSASLCAGFFTLLFGGTINDFFMSLINGALIKLLTIKLGSIKVNDFFSNVLGGGLAAFIAVLSVHLGIGNQIDKIIIGSIMLLVPGLAITNAIRDTIDGDLVSGISRTMEAFFIAVAIAVGSGVILSIWFMVIGGNTL